MNKWYFLVFVVVGSVFFFNYLKESNDDVIESNIKIIDSDKYSDVTMAGITVNVDGSEARRYLSTDICLTVKSQSQNLFREAEEGKASIYPHLSAAVIEILSSKYLKQLTDVTKRREIAIEIKDRLNEVVEKKTGIKDTVKEVIYSKFLIQ